MKKVNKNTSLVLLVLMIIASALVTIKNANSIETMQAELATTTLKANVGVAVRECLVDTACYSDLFNHHLSQQEPEQEDQEI